MEKSGRFQSDERRFARSRMKHVYEWKPWGGGGGGCYEGCGWRWTNLFPNNFQCSAVQRGWPAGIMYTRGLASLSSRGTVRRAKG